MTTLPSPFKLLRFATRIGSGTHNNLSGGAEPGHDPVTTTRRLIYSPLNRTVGSTRRRNGQSICFGVT
ncbi:uncharacterized protein G2W53_038554 [Senna tora]|uniref:Uncharacterized protein n=1 Tax=Senna tora TaxID=362788 RepID=A0A834SL92_9FABA|nr:uncharacterized protein G2W53_038554 [Senna tora]